MKGTKIQACAVSVLLAASVTEYIVPCEYGSV